MENNIKTQNSEEEKEFSLSKYLMDCLSKWRWFVCSVLIFLGIGILYILRQQPVYLRSEAVLVKNGEDALNGMGLPSAFSNFGFGVSNAKVNNELIAITSPAVMSQVVSHLNLPINYYQKEFFRVKTLYGTNCPIDVEFKTMNPEQGGQFKMTLNPDGSYKLYKFRTTIEKKKIKYKDEISGKLGFNKVNTPFGELVVKPSAKFTGKLDEPVELIISHDGYLPTVESYTERLNGDLADKDAEVIELSIKDVSTQRAVDILNAVVDVYNSEWMNDKNKLAQATSLFIDERLSTLEKELNIVDSDISEFRASHMLTDIQGASSVYMDVAKGTDASMLELENQLVIGEYFRDYLLNPTHKNDVLPMNMGFAKDGLGDQISQYNSVVLTRDNLVQKSSQDNPLVRQYDEQIAGLRTALLGSIQAYIANTKKALRNFEGTKDAADKKLADMPVQAKYLLSVERKQKVMEELYLFLLQKREENELSQTFAASNTRVITPPYGSILPVAPKKMMILAACFIIGLALPAMMVYYMILNDTKIRSKRDLDNLPLPFVGEIPFVGKKDSRLKKFVRSKSKNKKLSERPKPIVAAGSRDVSNEAFRVIRSNLEFMIGRNHECSVIMMTSFNPGSGKSFITYNLGAVFGLKGRKVLMIDSDLRHGSLSTYVNSPRKGLINYLTGSTNDWKSLLVSLPGEESVKLMPLGSIVPNPAEMLENGRLGELIEQARADFDYILLDCPPIDIVVDTQIIEKWTDRTIFVVRAGLLEKSALVDITELYNSKRYKHISLILNGTEGNNSRFFTYGTYEGVSKE